MVQTQLELQKLTAGSQPWLFPKVLDFPYQAIYNAFKFLQLGYPRTSLDFSKCYMVFERVYRKKIFSDFPLTFLSLFSRKKIGVGAGGMSFLRNNSQTWGANCSKPIFLPENLSKMEQSCRNVQLLSSLNISRQSICFLEQIFHRTQLVSVPG